MSEEIKVDPMLMHQTTVRLEEMSIGHGPEGVVDDSSRPLLESCVSLIHENSQNLSRTVMNYDDFLDRLAKAFETLDKEGAAKITSTTASGGTGAAGMAMGAANQIDKIKQSATYQSLP